MRFDLVIGNPPYNNDIYLDFVFLGDSITKPDTGKIVMVTPAKWQAKKDRLDKNKIFRDSIVPRISIIVNYKDSRDIFDIQEWGGICYYLILKQIIPVKQVKNICNRNSLLASDFENHTESNISLLPNKLVNLINKINTNNTIGYSLDLSRCVFVSEQERGNQVSSPDSVEVMQGDKFIGYKPMSELNTLSNLDKYKCICSIIPGAVADFDGNNQILGMFKISIIKPYQVPKGSFPILKYFDTMDECISFISYMNCKLIAFLFYLGICGTTLTKEFFRYIPDISDFSIIYEDNPIPGYERIVNSDGVYIDTNGNKHCSLYIKYSLSQSEIGLVENLIKSRS